jgi:hypothetical protein
MAIVKCKCDNTYFARVSVNQFKDNSAGLHRTMHEVEPDHDIKIYQCICCKSYMLPPIDYFTSTEQDKELYKIIGDALAGTVTKPSTKHRGKPIHKGTVGFIGGQNNPEQDGKFIKLE